MIEITNKLIVRIIKYNVCYENGYVIPYFEGLFILSVREV